MAIEREVKGGFKDISMIITAFFVMYWKMIKNIYKSFKR